MAKSKAVAMPRMDKKWQTESDLRTMQSFAELQSSPTRLRAVESLAKQQLAAICRVKGK